MPQPRRTHARLGLAEHVGAHDGLAKISELASFRFAHLRDARSANGDQRPSGQFDALLDLAGMLEAEVGDG